METFMNVACQSEPSTHIPLEYMSLLMENVWALPLPQRRKAAGLQRTRYTARHTTAANVINVRGWTFYIRIDSAVSSHSHSHSHSRAAVSRRILLYRDYLQLSLLHQALLCFALCIYIPGILA